MTVFRDNAPLYWAAGIPAIPLKPRQKMPILNEWTTYGSVMPSEAIRNHWLASYPHSNIGLPFGPTAGLCAIDIDSDDPEVNAILDEVLPDSPWVRVGKKGRGLIFKWNGQRNFKIQSESDGMLVEFLGLGNQMVLPPSIHPDTGLAYTANTNLWEVMGQIVSLPADIEEQIRIALGVKGVKLSHAGRSGPLQVVPEGARDIQMVRQAGYLARVVRGIDKSAKFSLHGAMEHMHTWVKNYTSTVAGDDMDPNKGVSKLLEFLLRDVEGGSTLPSGWDVGLTDEERAHPTIASMIEKNETARWSFEKARDWLHAAVLEDVSSANHALTKINELIEALAKDENFSEFEFNALQATIISAGGKDLRLSKPALTKLFKTARQGDTASAEDHEAIATQEIAAMSQDGELRWHQGYFWQWDGSCFLPLDDKIIFKHIAKNVKGSQLVKRGNDYKSLVETMSKLCIQGLIEHNEVGVNFANGFLSEDLVLHEHAMKYGRTFTLPFNYVPERAGEAHKWLAYLKQSWGQDDDYHEKVMALQEAFAATMFGIATDYQRGILLFGQSGAGKTRALEVLKALMPTTAVSSVSPHTWSERFSLAGLVGKALNVCGELPEDKTIGGHVFKAVIEGSDINTELKFETAFEYRPFAAQWFASNHLPFSKDSSEGFSRRWLIFDFNKKVAEADRIPNYDRIMVAEEREAIAAWAVDGLKRLVAQKGYTLCASHNARIEQIRSVNNSVIAFFKASTKIRLTGNAEDVVAATDVYDDYKLYMRDYARNNSVGFDRFTRMLAEIEGIEQFNGQSLGEDIVVQMLRGVKSSQMVK